MVNSPEESSHTYGTNLSHPYWDEKIPREGRKNPHVGILKYPRGKRKFSTWRRNKTSEESNETSEEMCPLPEKSTQLGRYY